jgi:PKD repeat protein
VNADATAGPAIVVEGPAGVRSEFDEEAVAANRDVEPRNATLRANAGEAGERIGIPKGLSVLHLIELSGAEAEAVGYLTVPRSGGSVAYLAANDFVGAVPADGPATVWVDQGCTHFFRPAVGSEPNAEDSIVSCGAPLAIGVRDGSLLSVSAAASTATATVSTAVEFTAGATGALPGERISFRWSFGDGASAEGARVTHPFAASGSYRVTVTATGNEESGGESAPVTLVVGNPPAGPGVGAGPEVEKGKKKRKPHGTGGKDANGRGDGKGGKGNGAGTGDDGSGKGGGDGTGDGGAGGSEGGTVASGAGREGAGESNAGSESSFAPVPFSIPEPPPSEVSPFSEAPFPASPAAPSEAATSPAAATPTPANPDAPSKGRGGAAPSVGQTVRGQLVADLFEAGSPEAGSGGSSADTAAESFASAPPSGGGSVPVVALLAAGLLAAGVLLEWRRRPSRRLR